MSLNIPAIKAGIEIGNKRVFKRAKDFGIRWQTNEFEAGPSIAIGTIELHIIDLISAYGAIANGGVLMPRTTILEVRDTHGKTFWPPAGTKLTGKKVVSPGAAFVMTNILASNTDPSAEPVLGQARDLRPEPGRRDARRPSRPAPRTTPRT